MAIASVYEALANGPDTIFCKYATSPFLTFDYKNLRSYILF
jgi:hypothetical protein